MFNALARDEVDAPSITGAEQQSSVAHRDSSRVTHFTFKNARESGDITLTDKQEKMKREMAILAQLTGVDDKLKLAILEATDEQQGKMIASLKERRAPFQWDEGGVDPFAVAAEQKRDRAIAYIEQQRKEHVALVERTRRERVREAKRRGREPLPYDEWTEFGMPSEGKAPIRGLGGDPSWRDTKDANLTPRAPKFGAPAAPASASPRGRRPPLHPTSPRNASARPRTAAGPPLLSPRSVVSAPCRTPSTARSAARCRRVRRRAARSRRRRRRRRRSTSSCSTRCARSTRRRPAGSSQSTAPSHPKSTRTTAAAASRRAGANTGTARRREWAAGPERVQWDTIRRHRRRYKNL